MKCSSDSELTKKGASFGSPLFLVFPCFSPPTQAFHKNLSGSGNKRRARPIWSAEAAKAASVLGLSASWENGNERSRRWRKPAQSPRMHDLGRHRRAVDHCRRRAALAGHHGRSGGGGSQGPHLPANQRQPYGF